MAKMMMDNNMTPDMMGANEMNNSSNCSYCPTDSPADMAMQDTHQTQMQANRRVKPTAMPQP